MFACKRECDPRVPVGLSAYFSRLQLTLCFSAFVQSAAFPLDLYAKNLPNFSISLSDSAVPHGVEAVVPALGAGVLSCQHLGASSSISACAVSFAVSCGERRISSCAETQPTISPFLPSPQFYHFIPTYKLYQRLVYKEADRNSQERVHSRRHNSIPQFPEA